MTVPDGAPAQLAGLTWIPISNQTKTPRASFRGGRVPVWQPRDSDAYGVVTGPVPGGSPWVWGLDFDLGDIEGVAGGQGALNFRAYLEENGHEWPETFTVQTGSGGLHLYFELEPDRWVKGTARHTPLGDYIDVRGGRVENDSVEGVGYLKAPPSEGYVVVKDVPIAVAPEWLYELVAWTPRAKRIQERRAGRKVRPQAAQPRSALGAAIAASASTPVERAVRWVAKALEGMDSSMESLLDMDSGWRQIGLNITASLAGLTENDLLAEAEVFSTEDAWEKMEEWESFFGDVDPEFYPLHLLPMFMGKLEVADPARLPEELELALEDYLYSRQLEVAESEDGIDLVQIYSARNIAEEPPGWLVDRWVIRGELNVLAGEPKTTKSTIAGMLVEMVPGRIAWFSIDGEAVGTTKQRLLASNPDLDPLVIPPSSVSTLDTLLGTLAAMAEELGSDGLIVIDSWAGLTKFLGENQYSNAHVRDLWDHILAAVSGCTILLVAHSSRRGDKSDPLMGSQGLHQMLVHLVQTQLHGSIVKVVVPFSRHMPAGQVLAAGTLPREDYSDRVPPGVTVYNPTESGTLVAQLDPDGWKPLIRDIFSTSGIDSQEMMDMGDWATRTGLPIETLEMALCLDFLWAEEGKGKQLSLSVTGYAEYLWNQIRTPEGTTVKQSLAADEW